MSMEHPLLYLNFNATSLNLLGRFDLNLICEMSQPEIPRDVQGALSY